MVSHLLIIVKNIPLNKFILNEKEWKHEVEQIGISVRDMKG